MPYNTVAKVVSILMDDGILKQTDKSGKTKFILILNTSISFVKTLDTIITSLGSSSVESAPKRLVEEGDII